MTRIKAKTRKVKLQMWYIFFSNEKTFHAILYQVTTIEAAFPSSLGLNELTKTSNLAIFLLIELFYVNEVPDNGAIEIMLAIVETLISHKMFVATSFANFIELALGRTGPC